MNQGWIKSITTALQADMPELGSADILKVLNALQRGLGGQTLYVPEAPTSGATPSENKPKPSAEVAIALLSGSQMHGICAKGAPIELLPFGGVHESANPYCRAFLHLKGPAAINAFLNELFDPRAVRMPVFGHGLGPALATELVVFGLIHPKHGDFFITSIHPGAVSSSFVE
jgi:hypothetical protein